MTGRNKSNRTSRKKTVKQTQQVVPSQVDDQVGSPPAVVKREQPTLQQVAKKIIRAENEEARTLKIVFKSNPDSQMKDFIKKAVTKPSQQPAKVTIKTPADNHPPAVAQELLETDDDVADNLAKLFKASKSFKNV